MSGTVIPFPAKSAKPGKPNAIRVTMDFGEWTIAYYCDHRFLSRLAFDSKAAAETEAERLATTGMEWRRGLKGTVYIMPDIHEGGCWAVANRSQSEDSDALLARHFSLDDAIAHAVRHAREVGAEFSLNDYLNHDGGAA